MRRGCFRVRSDSGFAFRRPTFGCAAAGGRHQGAPSRWSCWARFRPRRRRRLRARPGAGTAGRGGGPGEGAAGGRGESWAASCPAPELDVSRRTRRRDRLQLLPLLVPRCDRLQVWNPLLPLFQKQGLAVFFGGLVFSTLA